MRAHVNTATVADDYIVEPVHLMWGARAWEVRTRPDKGVCPVCGPGPRTPSSYCLYCDRASPEIEAQVQAARIKMRARIRAEVADKDAINKLHTQAITKLSECERRRIWNGGVAGVTM